ncbi:hypothetical protein HDU76_005972 [Blyttiomyces sp. JEL0837]|nr:hypothetical protein HDU76_005972 [Blyttiomyces sp. JEL0837]
MDQNTLHIVEGVIITAAIVAGTAYLAHEFKEHHDDKQKEESWIQAAMQQQQHAQANNSQLYWGFEHNGQLPHNAIRVGTDSDGAPLFAARCYYDHSIQVGKARQGNQQCSIAYDGREIGVDRFQVLCGNPNLVRWIQINGVFNYQAMNCQPLIGGQDKDGSALFIAVCDVNGAQESLK